MRTGLIQLLLVTPHEADVEFVRAPLAALGGDGTDWRVDQTDGLAAALGRPGPPDVVLMDLPLVGQDSPMGGAGEADGLDAVHERWPAVPVIVLAAADAEDRAIHAIESGAEDYVLRPASGGAGRAGAEVDPTRDDGCVARAVRRAVARRRAGAAADPLSLLRRIIDDLPDHVYAKDLNSRFILVNAATLVFFGAARARDVIGRTDFDLFPHDVASWFQWEERDIIHSGVPCVNREAEVTSAGGDRRWILTTKVPLRAGDGRVVGTVGVNRDITDRKRADERLREANAALARREQDLLAALADLERSNQQLRAAQLRLVQAERLELVGRLAAGVAHEVKNPLAVIGMGVEYLSHQQAAADGRAGGTGGGAGADGSDGSRAPANDGNLSGSSGALAGGQVPVVLRSIRDAARRADEVIRGLLDFSVPTMLTVARHDLNALLGQTLMLVAHEVVKCQARVVRDLAPGLPPVRADANKIEQVFVNLVMNALHAMPAGGRLTVRTYAARRSPADGALVRVAPGEGPATDAPRSNDLVLVTEVDDTGPGIAADLLAKVFDPFFTTKPTGKGSGLGLSVARTIVDLHGGTIDIANRPAGGARATVVLTPWEAQP